MGILKAAKQSFVEHVLEQLHNIDRDSLRVWLISVLKHDFLAEKLLWGYIIKRIHNDWEHVTYRIHQILEGDHADDLLWLAERLQEEYIPDTVVSELTSRLLEDEELSTQCRREIIGWIREVEERKETLRRMAQQSQSWENKQRIEYLLD